MSAYLDKSQKVGFYFGNAAIDLANYLPADEHVQEQELSQISAKASELIQVAELLLEHQREMNFLMADIQRFMPSKKA